MKNILVIFVTILSLAAIVVGKIHWDQKIEAKAEVNLQTSTTDDEPLVEDGEVEIDPIIIEEKMKLTKNLPVDVSKKIEAALNDGHQIDLVIMGSSDTPKEDGWPTLVKEEITNKYGEVIKVTIKEIDDKTSTEILEEDLHKDIVELQPDILLLEPFILYDNGKVRMEHRLENLTDILDDFYEENPDLTVMIQPANPLYNAVHYPREVDELKRYAEKNELVYIDHWEAWPDQQSEKIKDYLNDSVPNEEGHRLWADYILNTFISDDTSN